MYQVLRPWLFRLDPERAHTAGLIAARLAQAVAGRTIRKWYNCPSGMLGQRLFGCYFANPVGLAAGFDKNARLLPFWEHVGFGYAEIGSVTALRSKGNQRPRAFRLPDDEAIINRMGLPSDGAERIARRLASVHGSVHMPVGVSIAKTHNASIVDQAALEDYRQSFALVAPWASYVALNISCPNTADGRTFEEPAALDRLLDTIFRERRRMELAVPVLVKLSPTASGRVVFDSQIEEIVAVARDHGVHGFIASNTALDRRGLSTDADTLARIGPGGLSGPPLRLRTLSLVRYLYRLLRRETPIIATGGVDSARAAYSMLRAGASLVQCYTALAYQGLALVREIKLGLEAFCRRDEIPSIRQVIGADVETA